MLLYCHLPAVNDTAWTMDIIEKCQGLNYWDESEIVYSTVTISSLAIPPGRNVSYKRKAICRPMYVVVIQADGMRKEQILEMWKMIINNHQFMSFKGRSGYDYSQKHPHTSCIEQLVCRLIITAIPVALRGWPNRGVTQSLHIGPKASSIDCGSRRKCIGSTLDPFICCAAQLQQNEFCFNCFYVIIFCWSRTPD